MEESGSPIHTQLRTFFRFAIAVESVPIRTRTPDQNGHSSRSEEGFDCLRSDESPRASEQGIVSIGHVEVASLTPAGEPLLKLEARYPKNALAA